MYIFNDVFTFTWRWLQKNRYNSSILDFVIYNFITKKIQILLLNLENYKMFQSIYFWRDFKFTVVRFFYWNNFCDAMILLLYLTFSKDKCFSLMKSAYILQFDWWPSWKNLFYLDSLNKVLTPIESISAHKLKLFRGILDLVCFRALILRLCLLSNEKENVAFLQFFLKASFGWFPFLILSEAKLSWAIEDTVSQSPETQADVRGRIKPPNRVNILV